MNSKQGTVLFICIVILAFLIGSYILTATFFGVLTLVGLIALIESVPSIKWLASRSTQTIDVIIFLFSIFATMNYGLNIAASLTVAGLGYTLAYAPRLREQRGKSASKEQTRRTKVNRDLNNYYENSDWH